MRAVLRLIALALLLLSAAAAMGKPFLRDGDSVLFIGDNATLSGYYARMVEDYFTLRCPAARIRWYNTGWTDTARVRRDRLARDLALLRPTVVVVCYGMNDGGFLPLDKDRLQAFRAGMTGILDLLRKRHVRAVLLTPNCVDPAGDRLERIHRAGWDYNETLAVYVRETAALGRRYRAPVADAFTLMRDLLARIRRDDPAFTFLPDGIYPSPAGHAVIGYALLKAMGATPDASGLSLDAVTGKIAADRCTVTDLQVGEETLAFTRTDAALPMVFLPDPAPVDRYLPLAAELNRYPFAVTGLRPGRWALKVEGSDLGAFDAKELAAGIDLAARPGPWQALGRRVDDLAVQEFGAFCQDWVYLMQYQPATELRDEYAALLRKVLAAGDAHQQARMHAVDRRSWQWTLTRVP